MNIGVLKERKRDERRVALRPDQVEMLYQNGHQVFVEHSAGEIAGYPDGAYGAARLVDRETIYDKCHLLLKVKCPEPEEYQFLRAQQMLFTYLHFDENIPPEQIRQIVQSGVTGIAYEWVREGNSLPLLEPMSRITGSLFALKAMELLLAHRGVMGGAYCPDLPNPRAIVIGIGNLGTNAVNVLLRNGFHVTIIDKTPDTVAERLHHAIPAYLLNACQSNVQVIKFDEQKPVESVQQLRALLPATDIVICSAVRRPSLSKQICEYLITRQDVAGMPRNSVICDATACNQDLIETGISSSSLTDYYREEGVVHYNCDHIPSLAASTATRLLTTATFPYVLKLAKGFEAAVTACPSLFEAVMCYRGQVTHKLSAQKKGLPFTPLQELL